MSYPTRVHAWKTSDDRIFTSERQAETHERLIATTAVLDNLDISWRDSSPTEVAEALLARGYIITQTQPDAAA